MSCLKEGKNILCSPAISMKVILLFYILHRSPHLKQALLMY